MTFNNKTRNVKQIKYFLNLTKLQHYTIIMTINNKKCLNTKMQLIT